MANNLRIFAYLGPTFNNDNIKPFTLSNGVIKDHRNFMNGVPVTYDFQPIYFDMNDFSDEKMNRK
jgi:hypothetical protein